MRALAGGGGCPAAHNCGEACDDECHAMSGLPASMARTTDVQWRGNRGAGAAGGAMEPRAVVLEGPSREGLELVEVDG